MKWLLALGALGAAVVLVASAGAQRAPDARHGRALYVDGCSSCHGMDARGIPGRGPDLHGAGALAADFYLRTGRMPLAHPQDYPARAHQLYSDADVADLVAYVATLGGPPIPDATPGQGNLARGKELFTDSCAGCHQIAAQGGVVTPNAIAPALDSKVKPVDIAEAVRLGPYVMPRFGERRLTPQDVDDIAKYVEHTQRMSNPGGWSIGNLGPIPEGLVTWAIAIVALLGIARLVGKQEAP